MATSKHLALLEKPIPHHTAGGVTGGKCLAKHEPAYKEGCSCSHRWQAFEKAVDQKDLYKLTETQLRTLGDGPWSLLFRGGQKAVNKLAKKGETVTLSPENKGMYFHQVGKPGPGDWDIDRGKRNFKWDCNKPYYHEAHHVVPDATLRKALLEVFEADVAVRVVSEMLDAPYSVHHKDNMLLLPMDERVGDLLHLPIHRETKQCSHGVYDKYVEGRLITRLQKALEEIMEKHEEEGDEPKFKDLAKAIEAEARALHPQVTAARRDQGVASIEQFGAKLMPPSPKTS
jgi:hypothetical protein